MLATQTSLTVESDFLFRLAEARGRTDELFGLVRPEFLYDRPVAERHRLIFYIGHLDAFDWNLLRERLFGLPPFDPEFDRLFAFGIDPVGGGLPTDQPSDWPSIERIKEYVNKIRVSLDQAISRSLAVSENSDLLLNVAIEHRLMHAETIAYLLHQLPIEQKLRRPHHLELVAPQMETRMVEIPSGTATLGLSRGRQNFGWDNEFETSEVYVPGFAIDQHMVTNRQFLVFMSSGGYEDEKLWSAADWEWKTQQGVQHPAAWQPDGHIWNYRTMFDEIPLPMEWPVYVSHAEASAYARWAGKSLPTEAQWHRAAYGTPDGAERAYPWGAHAPTRKHGNFDFHSWHASPVGHFPAGNSAFDVADLLGNGWEWTSSLFEPFAGFKAFQFYPGYSANFFDGKHYVLKGGSARTAACMARRSFRNWFQPHYQYVYSGFRCVSNA
jgi:gamma-glutamyl hercynylcysteine S-oxide synthase